MVSGEDQVRALSCVSGGDDQAVSEVAEGVSASPPPVWGEPCLSACY